MFSHSVLRFSLVNILVLLSVNVTYFLSRLPWEKPIHKLSQITNVQLNVSVAYITNYQLKFYVLVALRKANSPAPYHKLHFRQRHKMLRRGYCTVLILGPVMPPISSAGILFSTEERGRLDHVIHLTNERKSRSTPKKRGIRARRNEHRSEMICIFRFLSWDMI